MDTRQSWIRLAASPSAHRPLPKLTLSINPTHSLTHRPPSTCSRLHHSAVAPSPFLHRHLFLSPLRSSLTHCSEEWWQGDRRGSSSVGGGLTLSGSNLAVVSSSQIPLAYGEATPSVIWSYHLHLLLFSPCVIKNTWKHARRVSDKGHTAKRPFIGLGITVFRSPCVLPLVHWFSFLSFSYFVELQQI
jgi:hypothetical protein